jgi:hypothetical protein
LKPCQWQALGLKSHVEWLDYCVGKCAEKSFAVNRANKGCG